MRISLIGGFIEIGEGTGGNHEVVQIRAYEKGKGVGTALLKKYKELYKDNPPHYCLYAFVLGGRTEARNFYKKNGFRELDLGNSIYKGDTTILMWIPFEEL